MREISGCMLRDHAGGSLQIDVRFAGSRRPMPIGRSSYTTSATATVVAATATVATAAADEPRRTPQVAAPSVTPPIA